MALVMVAFVAATPLSSHQSGGKFEAWTTGAGRERVRVTVQDQTGMVSAIATETSQWPAERGPANRRLLRIPLWGACCGSFHIGLAFSRSATGYEVKQVNTELGCFLLCLSGYGYVTLILWAPIDRGSVTLDSPYLSDDAFHLET
jgi:hypothetical protein